MKAYKFKIITAFLLIIFSIASCSVDDYKIQGRSTKESLIQNESSARSALAGIYDAIRPNSLVGYIPTMMALTLAGPEQQVISNGQGQGGENDTFKAFYNNDVKPVPANRRSGGILSFYKQSYVAINLANFFIKTIEENGIQGTSKTVQNQILAEAKALRAHAYFHLLRVFGQFYNPESEYGVITTTDVITNVTFLKRSKVSETYDLMIKDLEFAIKNVTSSNPRYFVTQEYAKGLLAKVYLYKGGVENWTKTARYCKDIIDNLGGKFELVSDFPSIFVEGLESKELIFSPYYNTKKTQIIGNRGQLPINKNNLKPSDYFKNLAQDDPRYKFTFEASISNKTDAYNKYPSTSSAFQFLRVAEVYLMYAEAVARTDGDMQDALDALNTVRKRAFKSTGSNENPDDDGDGDDDGFDGFDDFGGKPNKKSQKLSSFPNTYNFIDKETLLDDIRVEKMLELHIENAQSWFDFVRYAKLGDINTTELKSSIKNENQFIFPIPLRVIRNNKNFGSQNPGY